MLSLTQIQDRLNDVVGQLAVLDLALSSHLVADAINENAVNGFSAILTDSADALETVVNELDAFKQTYTPEEKQKFLKAVKLVNQVENSINPHIAVN